MHQWRQLAEGLPDLGKDLLAKPELITALSFADMHLIGFVLKLPVDVRQYSFQEGFGPRCRRYYARDLRAAPGLSMEGLCHATEGR